VTVCGCATVAPSTIQNNTSDPELAGLAANSLAKHLKANGIQTTEFQLVTRLDELPDGRLQLQIVCSTRVGNILKARVLVKGHGPSRRLIAALVAEATRDLAADCR
jgi:hypothetical protein